MLYKQKLRKSEEIAELIESGDTINFGYCTGTSRYVDKALANRIRNDELCDLKIIGGTLQWEPEIFKADPEGANFVWYSEHAAFERKRINDNAGVYIPLRYSELPRYYTDDNLGRIDYSIIQVSPMNEYGQFNFGPNASHMASVVKTAKTIIVEVNENMPICFGNNNSINIKDVNYIVEGDNPKIPGIKGKSISEIDLKVANYIIPEIHDGACLQLGIGGMPNAVGKKIAESDLKDLGVHTEMYVDAFMEMEKAGKITGKRKTTNPNKQAYTFAAGSSELYEYINLNNTLHIDQVDYINDVRVISSNKNFISINNAINVDLLGQVASENMGLKHVSGAGGQLDFVLGSYLSEGGKSFICLSSTFIDNKGDCHSRIQPYLISGTSVTVTRHVVQWIVTEFGMFNCKGKSIWERAEGIINLAHPYYREDLIKEAEKMNIWVKTNKRI